MCTLIAIHRSVPGSALVVAANRDEYLDRPSEGPALRNAPKGPVLAPLDQRAGGTWIGFSKRGVFAGLTNRPCPEPDRSRKSRGWVVNQALEAESAEAAASALARLPERSFNPFNVFVADAERAFQVVYQDAPVVTALEAGAHVFGNAEPNAMDVPKVARVKAQAERAAGLPRDEALLALRSICREHDGAEVPLDQTCVHLDGYGTRSSMLLCLGEKHGLWWCEGPPCENEYEDYTSLLNELSQTARYGSGETPARMAS